MAGRTASRFSKKKILWILLSLVAILLISAAVVMRTVSKMLTADYLVAKIEAENNCRVHIGTFRKSLFGSVARVELGDLMFLPRDEHADNGMPMSERPRWTEPPLIVVRSMNMSAALGDLLRGRISVREVSIDGLLIGRLLIPREGDNNLKPLFDPPVTVDGAPNPEFEDKQKRRDLARERRKLPKEERAKLTLDGTLNIDELPLPATLDALTVNNSEINVKLQKKKTRLKFYDVRIDLTEIDLDPRDLAARNHAKLSMEAKMEMTDNSRENRLAHFEFLASGDLVPFDKETGYLNPDLEYTITAKKGSEIVNLPSLAKLGATIEKLNSFGLKLDPISPHVVFQQDAVMKMSYANNVLRATEVGAVHFDDHRLDLLGDSWLDLSTNEHEFLADLYLAEALSQNALNRARGFLKEDLSLGSQLGGDIVALVDEMVFAPLTRENQLWLPFVSRGDIGKPKVRPRSEIKDLKELVKIEAGNKALDLLKGLLD